MNSVLFRRNAFNFHPKYFEIQLFFVALNSGFVCWYQSVCKHTLLLLTQFAYKMFVIV